MVGIVLLIMLNCVGCGGDLEWIDCVGVSGGYVFIVSEGFVCVSGGVFIEG